MFDEMILEALLLVPGSAGKAGLMLAGVRLPLAERAGGDGVRLDLVHVRAMWLGRVLGNRCCGSYGTGKLISCCWVANVL